MGIDARSAASMQGRLRAACSSRHCNRSFVPAGLLHAVVDCAGSDRWCVESADWRRVTVDLRQVVPLAHFAYPSLPTSPTAEISCFTPCHSLSAHAPSPRPRSHTSTGDKAAVPPVPGAGLQLAPLRAGADECVVGRAHHLLGGQPTRQGTQQAHRLSALRPTYARVCVLPG